MILKVDGPRAVSHVPRLETCDQRTLHDGCLPWLFALWGGRLRGGSDLDNASPDRCVAQLHPVTSFCLQHTVSRGGRAYLVPYCWVYLHHSPCCN